MTDSLQEMYLQHVKHARQDNVRTLFGRTDNVFQDITQVFLSFIYGSEEDTKTGNHRDVSSDVSLDSHASSSVLSQRLFFPLFSLRVHSLFARNHHHSSCCSCTPFLLSSLMFSTLENVLLNIPHEVYPAKKRPTQLQVRLQNVMFSLRRWSHAWLPLLVTFSSWIQRSCSNKTVQNLFLPHMYFTQMNSWIRRRRHNCQGIEQPHPWLCKFWFQCYLESQIDEGKSCRVIQFFYVVWKTNWSVPWISQQYR